MPILAKNRRAHHDYEILETLEAGIVLEGQEVKSVKAGRMNLSGAYITLRGELPLLVGAYIAPYEKAGRLADYDPTRTRRLLLKKKEIKALEGKLSTKGLTAIPLSVYTRKSRIKLEIAVARGKKRVDRREDIKKRMVRREIERAIRQKS